MAQSLQEQADAIEAAQNDADLPVDEPQNSNPPDGESAWLEGEGLQRERPASLDDRPLDGLDDEPSQRGDDQTQGSADDVPADDFSPEVLERAEAYGMTEAQARSYGSPQAMEQAILNQAQMLMSGQQQWGPQPPQQQQPQQQVINQMK